jgi:hypothetical protein
MHCVSCIVSSFTLILQLIFLEMRRSKSYVCKSTFVTLRARVFVTRATVMSRWSYRHSIIYMLRLVFRNLYGAAYDVTLQMVVVFKY